MVPEDEFDSPSGLYLVFNYLSYVFFVLILLNILVKFKYLKRKWDNYSQRFYILLGLLFIVIFCFIIGFIINSELDYRRIFLDFIPFLGCAIAFLGIEKKDFFSNYLDTIIYQSFIAAILCLYTLHKYPIIERGDFFNIYLAATSLLLPVVTLLPRFPYINLSRKLIVSFAFIILISVYLHMTLRTHIFIVLFLVPCLVFFTIYKQKKMIFQQRTGKSLLIGLFVVAICFPIIYSYLNRDSSLEIAFQQTIQRFSDAPTEDISFSAVTGSISHEFDFVRGKEAVEFVHNSTLSDWILGRGFGGTWDSIMHGINWHMVHFGPLHLVLKGGLLLTVSFLIVYIYAIFLAWKNIQRYSFASGCLIFLSARFVIFLTFGPLYNAYDTYIMWLMIGVSFSMMYERKSIRNISIKVRHLEK
jgi:hypothetical protein